MFIIVIILGFWTIYFFHLAKKQVLKKTIVYLRLIFDDIRNIYINVDHCHFGILDNTFFIFKRNFLSLKEINKTKMFEDIPNKHLSIYCCHHFGILDNSFSYFSLTQRSK